MGAGSKTASTCAALVGNLSSAIPLRARVVLCAGVVGLAGAWGAAESLRAEAANAVASDLAAPSVDDDDAVPRSIESMKRTFVERLVPLRMTTPGWSIEIQSLQASPDSAHIAYRMTHRDQPDVYCVARDDRRFFARAAIVGPVFSDDSSKLAYLGNDGRWKMYVHSDVGALGPDPVTAPQLSPDGSRVAYFARQGRRRFWVIDNKPQPFYDDFFSRRLAFSADSKHVAYAARRADGWRIIINGAEHGPFDHVIDGPVAAPVGASFVSAVLHQGQYRVVLFDGEQVAAHRGYERIEQVAFSPDGQMLAYWGLDASTRQWRLVVNGQAISDLICDHHGDLRFSPDSSRLAAVVGDEAFWRVMTAPLDQPDAAPIKHDRCLGVGRGSLTFSADSQHLAYTAVAPTQSQRSAWMIVRDGQPGRAYDQISNNELLFNDDGRRLAFVAKRDGRGYVVENDMEHGPFDLVRPGSLRFSVEGERFGFSAQRTGQPMIVLDGQKFAGADDVGPPVFDQTGVAAWLQVQNGQIGVCVEGMFGQEWFDTLIPGAELVSTEPGKFHSVFRRTAGTQLYRLEVEVKSPKTAPLLVEVETGDGE